MNDTEKLKNFVLAPYIIKATALIGRQRNVGGKLLKSDRKNTLIDHELKLVFDLTVYEYYFDYPKDIEYTEGYSSMRIIESSTCKNGYSASTGVTPFPFRQDGPCKIPAR